MDTSQPSHTSYMPLIIVFAVILILLPVFAFGSRLFSHAPQASNTIPTQMPQPQLTPIGKPQIKVSDLSPEVPNSQKTVILVQHSDSSREKFIMKTDLVAGYIKSLPEGEKVISQTPAGQ